MSFLSMRMSTSFLAFSAALAPSTFIPAGRAGGVEHFATRLGASSESCAALRPRSDAVHFGTAAFLAAILPLSEGRRGSLISLVVERQAGRATFRTSGPASIL